MLVLIQATFAPAPWVVKPPALVNVSQIGAQAINGPTMLLASRVANQSVFGTPVTRISKRYLRPAAVQNLSSVANKAFNVIGKLTQTRVVNESQVFGGDAIIISKHYMSPSTFQNVSTFGAPNVHKNVVTSYANWGGTGNRTHLITVTTSGITGGCPGNYGPPLVNGITNQTNCTDATAWGSNTAAVIKFDFRAGNLMVIDEFKWYQNVAASNGTWSFAGSNDDSSYTDLLTGINLGNGAATNTYSFSNSTGYRYYKLYQTAGNTSATPWLQEIEFKIANSDASATSYDKAGGKGNRSASITGSYSGLVGGCGSNYAQPLVDGSFVNGCSTAAAWGGANTAGILTFDFGVGASKIIDEFSWYQDVNATHGTWKISGSNDNSSYTDLGTGITLGVTSGFGSAAFAFTNTTGYRYYRLTQTGGTTSATSWDREIEFKIK